MRILIAALLSALLLAHLHGAPVNKQDARSEHHPRVTVAVKTTTPNTTERAQPEIKTADVQIAQTPAPVPTTHEELMAAAGIQPADYGAVDYIISHESSWRYWATEPTTGAYGLCQSLPASKMASAGSDWQDNEVTQLKWCASYAVDRYGSWWGAYNAWVSQNWW